MIREELKTLLGDDAELIVVGEAANVPQAVELVNQAALSAIFLDIQLPGAGSFDLLEQAEINAHTIFVAAYDQYALKAFEVNALDYLLKPIQKERMVKTI